MEISIRPLCWTPLLLLISLVTPVLALLLGQTLNGEEISARVWLGAALITAGLLLHQWPGIAGAIRRTA